MVVERYKGCRDDAEVLLYRTELPASEGGGHVWPGGRPPDTVPPGAPGLNPGHEINASKIIWDFFRGHRLPR